MTDSSRRDYGLPPQLRARLMGVSLVGIGLAILVITVLVVALELPADVLSAVVLLTVVGVFTLGFFLVRRWYVVRLDAIGYQVRFVRGAGARSARWVDVKDLATTEVAGAQCVRLHLRDGRSTTIPVAFIEGDKEEFVDELKRRLKST